MNDKMKAVVMAVLEEAGFPVHRTKLVKLVYLAENMYYEHFGETISGLPYVWDNFGPNAISNAVVKEADKLASGDFACIKPSVSMYGSDAFIYSVGTRRDDRLKKLLTPLEREIIRDTVAKYGRCSITEIVAVSKKTTPFKNAKQYTLLHMTQSGTYLGLQEKLRKDKRFMATLESVKRGLDLSGGVGLAELKSQYGL